MESSVQTIASLSITNFKKRGGKMNIYEEIKNKTGLTFDKIVLTERIPENNENSRNGGDYEEWSEVSNEGRRIHRSSSDFDYCKNCGSYNYHTEDEDDYRYCAPDFITAEEILAMMGTNTYALRESYSGGKTVLDINLSE